MRQPHILFVYKQLPGPSVGHAGGESLYRLMAGLHRRGFTISLMAGILDEEKQYLPELHALCEHIYITTHFRSLSGPKLIRILRSYMALRKQTKRVIKEIRPDLLHIETTQTAVALLGLHRPPACYRTQDVNWFMVEQRITRTDGMKKYLLQVKRWGFYWLESILCRSYDLVLAISKGDQQLLQPICDDDRLLLVPLGTPMPEASTRRTFSNPPILIFVGDMTRTLNVEGIQWFLNSIWPVILAKVPDIQLFVVGRDPPIELQQKADNKRIFVTGFVENLAPWYQKATIFISPLLVAGGLLQKVLDAMWLGVPVVATSVCNHGLGAEPGREIITADTAQDFAKAVVRVLGDEALRRRLSQQGQTYVKQQYAIEPALDRWAKALESLVQT